MSVCSISLLAKHFNLHRLSAHLISFRHVTPSNVWVKPWSLWCGYMMRAPVYLLSRQELRLRLRLRYFLWCHSMFAKHIQWKHTAWNKMFLKVLDMSVQKNFQINQKKYFLKLLTHLTLKWTSQESVYYILSAWGQTTFWLVITFWLV